MSYLRANIHAKERVNKIPQRTYVAKQYPSVSVDEVRLSEKGLSLESKRKAWNKIHDYISFFKNKSIGQQVNQFLRVSEAHEEYLDVHINNIGDPFEPYVGINTKFLERAILDYFAKLWNISIPVSSAAAEDLGETYWGYVVSMGSTEANLYALYNARDYLNGRPLMTCDINDSERLSEKENTGHYGHDMVTSPYAFTPIAFYSEAAHYSQTKAMRVLQIKTFYELGSGFFPCPLTYPDDYPSNFCEEFLDSNGWPSVVPADDHGLMHLPSLVKLVDSFASKGYPPIVIFTSGTTFRGSYEHPQAAINELVPILKRNSLYRRRVYYDTKDPTKFDIRHGFWFHVDGALGASYLPFLEMAINNGLIDNQFPHGFPVFDFRIPEVMSIALSFHKYIGCPFPSGIYMTRKKNQLKPPTNPIYIDSRDTTLSGSRNGHAVMIVWDYLADNSYEDMMERAVRHNEMVKFTLAKFEELQQEIGEDLWVLHDHGSLFVCIKRPRRDIVEKYALAGDIIRIKTCQGEEIRQCSHVCLMEHVDEDIIEQFIVDLRDPGAFPPQQSNRAKSHPSASKELNNDIYH